VLDKIAHCHEHSKIAAEPECLAITGDTGAGKTTAYMRYVLKHPRRETREGTKVPVLPAAIPVPATVKSLATKLLLKLGDPVADRGTVVNQTLRLQRLMRACCTELIILDEFQHFIDRDSLKILVTVSDWLKELLNETRIPVVLIGLPSSVRVLDANEQLRRRFGLKLSLDPFRWDTPEQRMEFRKFLRVIDDKLPLADRANLADEEMAYRFFCASGGVIAYVMKIVRAATSLAVERSAKTLELEMLAEAYEERLGMNGPAKKNPFLN
jgi:Cdc6-like AAA superfamily ATPase